MKAHRWSRVAALLVLATLVVNGAGRSDAFAHSAFKSSRPAPGKRLEVAPRQVSVRYTEPPTTASVMTVFDGCGNDVTRGIDVLNDSVTATTAAGEPGRWRVEWRVISAVDGHLTEKGISFEVAGEPDCGTGAAAPSEPPSPEEDPGNSLLIVLVVGAAVTIAGVALGARWALKAR